MDFWASFWDIIWWFLWGFAFIAYMFALFAIITDLFRDRGLSGWAKALWLIFMVLVPLLTSLVYLIARGEAMAERSYHASLAAQTAQESYIREVAATSPSDEITKARALRDADVITQAEYESLKSRALRYHQPTEHPVH